jgi:hypothetical protein
VAVYLFGGFCDRQEFLLLEFECKIFMYQDLNKNSFIGVKILREITTSPHNFSIGRTIPTLVKSTAVAYSTSTDLDDFNQLTSFDTDSSFWVCDNLATGHIYNNKALFMRELIPSIFDIGSATGT